VLHSVLTSAVDGGWTSAACTGQFAPGAEPVLPIGYQDMCAVEAVWMIWIREKS
jgi:hypothetical protein